MRPTRLTREERHPISIMKRKGDSPPDQSTGVSNSRNWTSSLSKNILHDVSLFFDSSQSLVEALVFEGQSPVVDAETVENGGVHVTDMDRIFNDVVAVIVSLPVFETAFHTGSSHPH